ATHLKGVLGGFPPAKHQPQWQRKSKNRKSIRRSGLLLLLDLDAQALLVRFVTHLNLEIRVSRRKDILVEHPIDVVSGGILDGPSQIHRLDALSAVGADVMPDGSKEQLVTQPAAQLVKYQRALLVEVAIEKIHRLVEFAGDDRAGVVLAHLLEVSLEEHAPIEVCLVAALGPLLPENLAVGREPFVEPAVGPFSAGEQIAEP